LYHPEGVARNLPDGRFGLTLRAVRSGSKRVAARWMAGAGLLLLGCGAAPPPEPRNVLLIVVDTLRADHLGAYGYPLATSPHIDAFAEANLKFNYAISAAPWTSPSVASIFTGDYPTAHGVTKHASYRKMPDDAISPDFTTLAEVLNAAGYTTWGITANAWVSEQRGYAQGFDRFDSFDYSRADALTKRAAKRLRRLRDKQPFLLYVHYMDPHPPLRPPKPLLRRFRKAHARLPETLRPATAEMRERMIAYDGEIAFLDAWIGRLFELLRELGLYDRMVIAFVADHGLPFMEHGARSHGRMLHNEDTHVPMILKLPGRQGEIDPTVSTIDLYPTLVRALGLEVPPGLQGVSLLDQLDERERRGAFSEITVREENHRSLVTKDAHKLILAFDKQAHEEVSEEDEQAVVGLYHSREDYLERQPIQDEAEIAALRRRLWEVYRQSLEIQHGVTPARTELSPETIEQLRRLGYLDDDEDAGR
jgi:arylsulfatase